MSQNEQAEQRSITPKRQQQLMEAKKMLGNTMKVYEQLKEKTAAAQQQENNIKQVIQNAEQQITLMQEQKKSILEKMESLKVPDDYTDNFNKQMSLIDDQMEKMNTIESKYQELVTQNQQLKKELIPLKAAFEKKQNEHVSLMQLLNKVFQSTQAVQEKLQRLMQRNQTAHEVVKSFIEGQQFFTQTLQSFTDESYKKEIKKATNNYEKTKAMHMDVIEKKVDLQTQVELLQKQYEELVEKQSK